MTRIDAHQHYWQLARGDYGWLTRDLAPIYRDFGPADLAPHLAAFGIARTILVQAAPTEAETAFMLDLAEQTSSVAAVVGWVDMEAREAAQRIAALARRPKFVGLRPMIHDIDDPNWMLSPGLVRAFEAIEAEGLTFDALVRPGHLKPLLALVERRPGLTVIVDHGAKPQVARWVTGDAAFARWAEAMRGLARHPSVACKVSGFVTEARPDWRPPDLHPYLDALLEAFGPERLLFGSDWPVVNLAKGYEPWANALLDWMRRLDPGGTGHDPRRHRARVYKLTEH